MKVSFDFDGTLGHNPYVEEYAKELIQKGFDVHITTTRWDRTAKICAPDYYKANGSYSWSEVYDLAFDLGIPIKNIHFTNYTYKVTYFKENQDFAFHLDDNPQESSINNYVNFVLLNYSWKDKCENILINHC